MCLTVGWLHVYNTYATPQWYKVQGRECVIDTCRSKFTHAVHDGAVRISILYVHVYMYVPQLSCRCWFVECCYRQQKVSDICVHMQTTLYNTHSSIMHMHSTCTYMYTVPERLKQMR